MFVSYNTLRTWAPRAFGSCAIWWTFCFSLAVPTPVLAVDLGISAPANDTMTMSEAVDVEGMGSPDGEIVHILVNDDPVGQTQVSGGKWSVRNVRLADGVNFIEARIQNQAGEQVAAHLVVRGDANDNIAKRPTQKVYFEWNDTAGEIRKIVQGTTRGSPSPVQLNKVVETIMKRTLELFIDEYKSFDLQIVSKDGVDVHKISFVSGVGPFVGLTDFDCGNKILKQTSTIYVGLYRRSMTGSDFETTWRPMKRSDNLEVRAEDIARVFARTAAHETGHGLGLVGQVGDNGCAWMDGCREGHNCQEFDSSHSLLAGFEGTNRFGFGWHFMDPGEHTPNNVRLGEPKDDQRTAQRRASNFSVFSASYLAIIHPR